MHVRSARAAALVLLAAAGAACTKTLDTSGVDGPLQAYLATNYGIKGASIHCPSNVHVKTGTTFTCTATASGGITVTFALKQRDANGSVGFKVTGITGPDGSPTPIPPATPIP
jgi:hypothetical protein